MNFIVYLRMTRPDWPPFADEPCCPDSTNTANLMNICAFFGLNDSLHKYCAV